VLSDIEFRILTTILNNKTPCRPSEIKEKCKLTEPTMHKYLKSLVSKKYLIKKISRKANEYPHPVYYHINPKNTDLQNMLISGYEPDKDIPFSHVSKAYVKLSIAREILKEHGIKDTEIDIRYYARSGVKKFKNTEEDDGDDEMDEDMLKEFEKQPIVKKK
jgi:hypothetical protein